jgi:hypothetical protein
MHFTTQKLFHRSLKLGLALFLLLAIRAQAEPAPQWTNVAGFGGSGTDIGAAIRISRNGDRYVTGSFSTVASFAGKPLTSEGGSDIFLAKYARGGDLLWLI